MPVTTQLPNETISDIESPLSQLNNADEIMKSLATVVDNMQKNKSILSQIADWWGPIPLWIKISAGLVVIGLIFIIGILTASAVLIATSCVCSLLYTLLSLGLTNHYETSNDEHDQFKCRIMELGDHLRCIINELKNASVRLSTEIDRLSELMTRRAVDFEKELSELRLQAEASQKLNDVLGNMIKAFSSCLDQNHRSYDEFSATLTGHINDIIAGKECFFQTLDRLSQLENKLATTLSQYDQLFQRHDALVTKHQNTSSIGTQTEQLLAGIISMPPKRGENPANHSSGMQPSEGENRTLQVIA